MKNDRQTILLEIIEQEAVETQEQLLRLLLEKQVVRGSTGAITLLDGAISFFPNGSDRASACRPLTYEKKHR